MQLTGTELMQRASGGGVARQSVPEDSAARLRFQTSWTNFHQKFLNSVIFVIDILYTPVVYVNKGV